MTGKDAFKIWAPAGARWTDWVRPVPFAAMQASPAPYPAADALLPSIAYIAEAPKDACIVVDLPGGDAVVESIALARLGFRPIPLYNGTNGQAGAMALIDNRPMENALWQGAFELEKIDLSPHAPPAFLLDCNRTHRYKMTPNVFDNSWDIYDQDMPSAAYLLASGIRRVIVRGSSIQKDLARILYNYQKKGIAIYFTDGFSQPKARKLRKPPRKYN